MILTTRQIITRTILGTAITAARTITASESEFASLVSDGHCGLK
jgi:hypothetical protein